MQYVDTLHLILGHGHDTCHRLLAFSSLTWCVLRRGRKSRTEFLSVLPTVSVYSEKDWGMYTNPAGPCTSTRSSRLQNFHCVVFICLLWSLHRFQQNLIFKIKNDTVCPFANVSCWIEGHCLLFGCTENGVKSYWCACAHVYHASFTIYNCTVLVLLVSLHCSTVYSNTVLCACSQVYGFKCWNTKLRSYVVECAYMWELKRRACCK